VGREEGRGNQNLPPSQIWRQRLGLEEREERGQREKGKRKKKKKEEVIIIIIIIIIITQKVNVCNTSYTENNKHVFTS
jgi:hypothetical protein